MPEEIHHPSLPTQLEAMVFSAKATLFQIRRALRNFQSPVPRHPTANVPADAPILAELRTELWNEASGAEFVLKAGKIQNLRVACQRLNHTIVPAGSVFSFWSQIGRTTRGAGYTTGRELRSGCLVPNLGGGLCSLSGLLYEAALKCGFEIIERHGHSRILPGMTADPSRDATIFWNYVDLRFRVPCDLHIEATLDATHLILRFRGEPRPTIAGKTPTLPALRPHTSGDCLTCGETRCFRHPTANAAHPPQGAHTAFLLDAFTPEMNAWCGENSRPGDRWFMPLDPARWQKPNYAWTPPENAQPRFATLQTLIRSWKSRRLPKQGPIRQNALLLSEKRLAEFYARQLDPCATHLVISQNLLPFLWDLGVLGGRTFDVLIQRLPFADLHQVLDQAALAQPFSKTLADFRAPPSLVHAESAALRSASKLITPHRDLARRLGSHAVLVDWSLPQAISSINPGRRIFLPCSPLARKGIHELAAALHGLDLELIILGGATETGSDPLAKIHHRRGTIADLKTCAALVLPAWIEHQPRLALLALASGIPVVATRACGLPAHPLLREIPRPDPALIRLELDKMFAETAGSPEMPAAV